MSDGLDAEARALYERGPVLSMRVDRGGTVVDANPGGADLLARAHSDLVGASVSSLCADGPAGWPRLKRALDTLGPEHPPRSLVLEVRRLDGSSLTMLYTIQPIVSGGALVGSRHVGMELAAESLDARIRAARQDAQRELVSNLSHNLNNILTGVLAPAQLLLETVLDPDAQQDLRDILKATSRARSLLREMYQTVRAEPEAVQALPLPPLLRKLQDGCRGLRDPDERGVALAISLPAALPAALAVEEPLIGVLSHLIGNAAEARPRSGRVQLRLFTEPNWIIFEVSDDGIGMDPRTRQRVFEPLFSTKASVGAGMSLAAARARVQQWGGELTLDSRLGEGTTVRLRLPSRPVTRATPATRRGRVLLVEDVPHIARALSRMFAREHDIAVFHSGPALLEQFTPGDYDAALIDLTMPEMSGDQVAQALRARDPELTLLLLTGWLIQRDDPLMAHFDGILQKPITDMARAREVLREATQDTARRRAQP